MISIALKKIYKKLRLDLINPILYIYCLSFQKNMVNTKKIILLVELILTIYI